MSQKHKRLEDVKATVGQFLEEMKSTSIIDFVVWLDCKIEYNESQIEKAKEYERQVRMEKR